MVQQRAPRRALDVSRERTRASAAYCREIPGGRIAVWPSILWMLGQFVDTNRDLRAWRRRGQNGPDGGTMASLRLGHRGAAAGGGGGGRPNKTSRPPRRKCASLRTRS